MTIDITKPESQIGFREFVGTLGKTTWTKFDEFSENFRMGGGGSFPIRKIMLRFFGKGKALRAPISRTKAQHCTMGKL